MESSSGSSPWSRELQPPAASDELPTASDANTTKVNEPPAASDVKPPNKPLKRDISPIDKLPKAPVTGPEKKQTGRQGKGPYHAIREVDGKLSRVTSHRLSSFLGLPNVFDSEENLRVYERPRKNIITRSRTFESLQEDEGPQSGTDSCASEKTDTRHLPTESDGDAKEDKKEGENLEKNDN